MDTNPLAGAMREAQLCREELDIALISALRGDQVKTRDEALSAFYAVIAANESAAIQVRKVKIKESLSCNF